MPVTLKSASEEAIEQSVEVIYVVDELGRRFGLKKPSVLAQFRLVDLLGSETAQNQVYMGMILPMIWIISIEKDGLEEEVRIPVTRAELDALIQRVDEPGMVAIAAELEKIAQQALDLETSQVKNG